MTDADPKQIVIPAAVTEIAKRAKVKGMNLVRCKCELVEIPPGLQIAEIKIELRGGSSVHKSEPRTLVCSFGIDTTLVGPGGKPPKVALISSDYVAQYEFDDEVFFGSIREEDRNQFAAINTSFQLWPHVREFVQSMAARMSLPPIVLPAFRPLEMIGTPETWQKRTGDAPQNG